MRSLTISVNQLYQTICWRGSKPVLVWYAHLCHGINNGINTGSKDSRGWYDLMQYQRSDPWQIPPLKYVETFSLWSKLLHRVCLRHKLCNTMCRKSSAILLLKQKVNNLTSSTGLDENDKKVPPMWRAPDPTELYISILKQLEGIH